MPSGLTKAQYEKIRSDQVSKKAANYDRNVKKAFKFQDYTAVSFVVVLLCYIIYGLKVTERYRHVFYRVFLYIFLINHPVVCSPINNFIMSIFLNSST